MCELLNLSMQHRRTPSSNMMVSHLCLDSVISTYGAEPVISGCRDANGEFLDDTSLGGEFRVSARGETFMPQMSVKFPTYMALLRGTHDNLGKYEFLGMNLSVSERTRRICPSCNITSEFRKCICNYFSPICRWLLTTTGSHQRDCEIVQELPELSSEFSASGVDNAYSGVPNFDSLPQTVQEQMHNEFSNGLAVLHSKLLLTDLFNSDSHNIKFKRSAADPPTVVSFNDLLKDYDGYSPRERLNKPSTQKARAFEKDGHLLWTAAEAKVFCAHSERILGPHVNKVAPEWVCWQKHVHYLRLMGQTEISEAGIISLNDAILDHHTMFALMYPASCIPKFHYIQHAALCIFINGLPRETSAWYMERQHQYFKNLVRVSLNNSSVNSVLEKLATRYCRATALSRRKSRLDGSNCEVTGVGKPTTNVLDFTDLAALVEEGSTLAMVFETDTMSQLLLEDAFPANNATCNSYQRIKYQHTEIQSGKSFTYLRQCYGEVVCTAVSFLEVAAPCGSFFFVVCTSCRKIKRTNQNSQYVDRQVSLASGGLFVIDLSIDKIQPVHFDQVVGINCDFVVRDF